MTTGDTDDLLRRIRDANAGLDHTDHGTDPGAADGYAYAITDLIRELDQRLTAGELLPRAWRQVDSDTSKQDMRVAQRLRWQRKASLIT